jgi:YidC/Oxa1 family membrane protein insertase
MYNWPIIRDIINLFGAALDLIHSLIQSYGWSIVVLTILFRGLLLPLDIKSKISMKKTALLQPKLAKINEKYKNDKEKAAQKTMELYRQEKVSPLSGCLPALAQWPLLIAFFGTLSMMAGTQMHALYTDVVNNGVAVAASHIEPWLWVHNVWAPDTAYLGPTGLNFLGMNSSIIPPYATLRAMTAFQTMSEPQYNIVMNQLSLVTSDYWNGWFILPLLAGLTSWLSMKMTMPPPNANPNPAQKNPMSGKFMRYLFPAISVYFTAVSNSVFALYWITSNIVSIATYKGVDIVWNMNAAKRENADVKELTALGKPAVQHGHSQPKEIEAQKAPAKPAQGKSPQQGKPGGSSYNKGKKRPGGK